MVQRICLPLEETSPLDRPLDNEDGWLDELPLDNPLEEPIEPDELLAEELPPEALLPNEELDDPLDDPDELPDDPVSSSSQRLSANSLQHFSR